MLLRPWIWVGSSEQGSLFVCLLGLGGVLARLCFGRARGPSMSRVLPCTFGTWSASKHSAQRFMIPPQVRSIDDLRACPATRRLIHRTLSHVPASNIPTEDRFARVSVQHQACHGHVPCLSSLASRHILGEAQEWHHLAM